MNVSLISIEKLRPYENNPRKITDEAVEKVMASIKEFGFQQPIVVDKDMVIIVGHTRLKAAKKLGLKSVPVVVADNLSDEQVRAYRLADNKTNEFSQWNDELLSFELQELECLNFDMEPFGFEIAEEEEKEIIEDDFSPLIPEEPVCKRGDIYQLGDHYLMCGDSTSPDDVRKLLNGTLVDLVVTDPPYNVNVKNSKGMKIMNDDMGDSEFLEFLGGAFSNLAEALKPGGVFYVWYASKEHINFERALNKAGLEVREQLVWNKNSFILGRQDYHWKHELCLYGWKDGAAHYFIDDRTQSTVFEDKGIDISKLKKEEMAELLKQFLCDRISTTVINEDKPNANDLHPTMKPIKLIARQIKNSSKMDETVLDLFGGSGSTMIACEQLGRRCFTMEYDPHYADVIIDRWEQFTGREAVKVS